MLSITFINELTSRLDFIKKEFGNSVWARYSPGDIPELNKIDFFYSAPFGKGYYLFGLELNSLNELDSEGEKTLINHIHEMIKDFKG